MIEISAELSCDVATAWACWTEPSHIVQWNFAGDDWCCPESSNELTLGGRLSSRMEARDGSFGFDFVCTYEVIEPQRRLQLLIEDGRRWEIWFDETPGGCRVSERFEPESQNDPELQRAGWQMILNRFASYASAQSETTEP